MLRCIAWFCLSGVVRGIHLFCVAICRRGSSADDAEMLMPLPSPSNTEDQAVIARSEVGRLEAVVKLLSERLAQSEANAAAAEVGRRAAISAAAGGASGAWVDLAKAAGVAADSGLIGPVPVASRLASVLQAASVAIIAAVFVSWVIQRRGPGA